MTERIFQPLGMIDAAPSDVRKPALPGYLWGRPVSRWHSTLNGDGGWECSLNDMARYLAAHVDPESAPPLGPAIRASLAYNVDSPVYGCLGWGRSDGNWAHDGGTGGFSAVMAFNPDERHGVVVLTNSAHAELSNIALDFLDANSAE